MRNPYRTSGGPDEHGTLFELPNDHDGSYELKALLRPRLSGVSVLYRFSAFITPEPNSGCWLWTGFAPDKWRDGPGYGRFRLDQSKRDMRRNRPALAHRVAWALTHGAWPKPGQVIMHTCDVTTCVNPRHLRLGTQAENNRDRDAKGRHRTNPLRGEDAPQSKLKTADVLAIRAQAKEKTNDALAAEFGIGERYVRRIVNGQSWKHITGGMSARWAR